MSLTPDTLSEDPRTLSGFRVVAFENRMARELRTMLERYGASVTSAPAMREVGLEENPAAQAFAQALIAGQLDIVIFLTGVGVKTLFEIISQHYQLSQIIEALGRIVTAARGPKVVRVLREAGLQATINVPEPNTSRELLEALCKRVVLKDKRIAIQEYGTTNPELVAGLEAHGAVVRSVPVYRWALPEDRSPLIAALTSLVSGNYDIALFTSSTQVTNVLQVARAEGLESALRREFNRIVVGSIGPVCSEVLRKYGFAVDVEPAHPKLGHLVKEIARQAPALVRAKKATKFEVSSSVASPPVRPDKAASEAKSALSEHPILKACRLEPTPYTPVWLMRQAGRYMPEYRRMRERFGFLEMCRRPELAAEITVTAVEKLGVDAAIIFSDILLALLPTGVGVRYETSDGPVIEHPIRCLKDVERLAAVDPSAELETTGEAIKLVRRALGDKTPVIGFAGAPFTLASYLVEGKASRQYLLTKRMMYTEEATWKRLMEALVRLTAEYLRIQIAAGANLIQLFDSWVGNLSPDDYRRYILPHTAALIATVPKDVPLIHFGTATGNLLELMAEAGGDVIGLDWRVSLREAWRRLNYKVAVQGNLDPAALLADVRELRAKVAAILDEAEGRPGHIFNLGHGVLPQTPVDHVIALVDAVHEMSAKFKRDETRQQQ